MSQRNVRGAYLCLEHDRQADWDWLSKWQPNVIRYMAPGNHSDPNSFGVSRVRRIHETCPDATILLRCWDVDDRNFEAHAAMVSNPRAEAERQVDWWVKVFDRAEATGVPRAKLMAGLNNETGPEKDASLYPYTERALEKGTALAVRLGVFVFSVGRPSLAGESQYDIPYFSHLDNAILANNGAALLHQYMQPEGMYAVWTDDQGNERKDYGYLIGRDLHWEIKSPIIIAEWGIDGILYNRHPDPKYGNSGWRNFKAEWPPSRYADEYVACVTTCNDNVIATCPFISDFSDHKWQSFDLLDAYEEFLGRKDLCVREVSNTTPDTPPVTVHIPSVGTGTLIPSTPAYVIARAGANIRTAPINGQVITAVPYGEQIRILGVMDTSGWLHVRYGEFEGYMASQLVGLVAPEPLPSEGPQPVEPPDKPTGDKWERSIAWVLAKEGGFQNNPADKGNYYQGKLIGTKYGISARSWGGQYDIPNLTVEQAKSIYFEHYWRKSGADRLEWPLCLLVVDTAILHGVGAAETWLKQVGPNPYAFAAKRLRVYTQSEEWEFFGAGWVNRVSSLLEEMGK